MAAAEKYVAATVATVVRELARAVHLLDDVTRRVGRLETFVADLDSDVRDAEEAVPGLRGRIAVLEERLDALAGLHDEMAGDVAWDRSGRRAAS